MKNNINTFTPSFYLYLHEKVWEIANREKQVKTEDAMRLIGVAFNIKKPLRYLILREMKNFELLDWVNRDLIILKKQPTKILENISEHQRQIGCWH